MNQNIITTYGGTLRPIPEESRSYGVLLQADWPSGVSLQVVELAQRPNILVNREGEILFRMIFRKDEFWEDSVERTARKIAQGAYVRQKTAKERAAYLVKKDQLTSCMNQTKWLELRQAMQEEMRFPPAYTFKLLDEMESLEDWNTSVIPDHIGDWEPEFLPPPMLVLVEWLKIDPRLAKGRGRLIDPEITDVSNQLREVLARHNISYEERYAAFIIYGYRRPGQFLK